MTIFEIGTIHQQYDKLMTSGPTKQSGVVSTVVRCVMTTVDMFLKTLENA